MKMKKAETKRNTTIYSSNYDTTKCLNKLVIAKITSQPSEKTLYKIPTLNGQQILRAMRHINRINNKKEAMI